MGLCYYIEAVAREGAQGAAEMIRLQTGKPTRVRAVYLVN